jgi:hypothetical protein
MRKIGDSLRRALAEAVDIMKDLIITCSRCQWQGKYGELSWSDASVERQNANGVVEHDHRHIPICPRCCSDQLSALPKAPAK